MGLVAPDNNLLHRDGRPNEILNDSHQINALASHFSSTLLSFILHFGTIYVKNAIFTIDDGLISCMKTQKVCIDYGVKYYYLDLEEVNCSLFKHQSH